MKSGFFSLRYMVTLVLIMISVGLLYWSWKTYDLEIEVPINGTRQINSTKHLNELKELSAMMNKPRGSKTGHEVIAEKNLFSKDRSEWQQPAAQQVQNQAGQIMRHDVILYGIFKSGDREMAILGLPRISSGSKKFILAAGENVKSPPDKPPFSYTLVSIKDKAVTVKDQAGAIFSVGLYDHKRTPSSRRPPAHLSKSGTKVVTTKVQGSAAPAGGIVRPGGPAPSAAKAEKSISSMSKREKEALVKKGQLKKVSTPFGTLYRPVKK